MTQIERLACGTLRRNATFAGSEEGRLFSQAIERRNLSDFTHDLIFRNIVFVVFWSLIPA